MKNQPFDTLILELLTAYMQIIIILYYANLWSEKSLHFSISKHFTVLHNKKQ